MPNLQPGANWAEQKVSAPDGNPQAWFGSAVAISGDLALVGAKNATVEGNVSRGAVYVFKRTNGVWTQIQKLVSADGVAGDQFGANIALNGNNAVITAPFARIDGKTWQGAAYYFSNGANGWTQIQKIVASDGLSFDTFGVSATINDQWAFIGAGGATRAGAVVPLRVYVFAFAAGYQNSWVQRQVLKSPSATDPTSAFGNSTAISGTVALVGARASTVAGKPGQGIVYVYTYSANTWKQSVKLVASDGAARDNFGLSVGLQGDMALIGAPGVAFDNGVSQGAVYQFRRIGKTWQQTQKFTSSDGVGSNLFGASLSLYKNNLLVGAYAADSYTGAAYLFRNKATVWTQSQKLTASDGAHGNVFGYYVALGADSALVGSYTATIDANAKQGAAYFYSLPSVGGAA